MKLDKSLAHDYVRARYREGASQAQIGRELGVTQQAVCKIMRTLGMRARRPGRPRAR